MNEPKHLLVIRRHRISVTCCNLAHAVRNEGPHVRVRQAVCKHNLSVLGTSAHWRQKSYERKAHIPGFRNMLGVGTDRGDHTKADVIIPQERWSTTHHTLENEFFIQHSTSQKTLPQERTDAKRQWLKQTPENIHEVAALLWFDDCDVDDHEPFDKWEDCAFARTGNDGNPKPGLSGEMPAKTHWHVCGQKARH